MRKGIITIATFFLISLSTIVWAVDCPIPDTGQTKCYDNTQEELSYTFHTKNRASIIFSC